VRAANDVGQQLHEIPIEDPPPEVVWPVREVVRDVSFCQVTRDVDRFDNKRAPEILQSEFLHLTDGVLNELLDIKGAFAPCRRQKRSGRWNMVWVRGDGLR
jgi:hypothetical protein